MRMTGKRIFQTRHCKTAQTALRALTLAALLAAGVTALTPHAALAFVCDEDDAGESGIGAVDGGVIINTACGFTADASGASSENTAIGNDANASGDASRNTATGTGANASGGNSHNVAIGELADASGGSSNNTAVGRLANASGDSMNTAIGRQADARGDNTRNVAIGAFSESTGGTTNVSASTAVGGDASATFANSAAFGNGATTTRVNQQVFGTASNTYTMPGVASAASSAAQGAVTGVVTTDAQGNLASASIAELQLGDNPAIRENRDGIRENRDGIAMAMAMGGSYLPRQGESVRISGNLGTFNGSNALSFSGAALVSGNNTFLTGTLGVALNGSNEVGGRVGVSFGW